MSLSVTANVGVGLPLRGQAHQLRCAHRWMSRGDLEIRRGSRCVAWQNGDISLLGLHSGDASLLPTTSGHSAEDSRSDVLIGNARPMGRAMTRARRVVVGARRVIGNVHRHLPAGLMVAFPTSKQIWADLMANEAFIAGFWGWLIAQVGKVFTYRITHGKWRFRALLDSGGMPSSHSSLCVGVTTSIALTQGFSSSAFATALAFSLIVMYDAAGVRRHAGKQAQILNKIILSSQDEFGTGTEQLKEVLGHTPLQVFAGCVLGIVTGCVVHAKWAEMAF